MVGGGGGGGRGGGRGGGLIEAGLFDHNRGVESTQTLLLFCGNAR